MQTWAKTSSTLGLVPGNHETKFTLFFLFFYSDLNFAVYFIKIGLIFQEKIIILKIRFNNFHTKCLVPRPNQIILAEYNMVLASVAVAKVQLVFGLKLEVPDFFALGLVLLLELV